MGKRKETARQCRERLKLVEQIPKSEEQEYNCIMAEMLEKYGEKKPPAMPCTYTSDETDGEALSATQKREGNSSPKKKET